MNSFIYTESAIFPIQAMLPEDFPFFLEYSYVSKKLQY